MGSTISKPTPHISEEILTFLQIEEQRTTIIHCRIETSLPTLARIWDTTYLEEQSGEQVSLIKVFNISMAPDWTWFEATTGYLRFTLVFEGLSKACTHFKVVEKIAEPGGFFSHDIERNQTDVYEVELLF